MLTRPIKTVRGKLTFWYATSFILLGLLIVVFINLIIFTNRRVDPVDILERSNDPRARRFAERIEESHRMPTNLPLTEIINQVRLEDMVRIRNFSLLAFVGFSGISIAGGYYLAGTMLKPLYNLSSALRRADINNLEKVEIKEDIEDEIKLLIQNYNRMVERLDSSVQLQKQFIEDASHELKTPLTVVRANLDLLSSKMEELDREELNEAIKSIQFMNKIIEDLALLSMLEGSIEFEKIDLIDDLEIVEEFLQKIAEKKKIEIKVKTNTKELYYSANQALFRRAVMNLVENAIKYSPKGSKVILELEKLENKVVIKIIDQGNGISEVEKEKIFERFYREDRSRSRDSGGSGLGLSIAQKIVSLHGGELKLESKESEGSTFFIVLPT